MSAIQTPINIEFFDFFKGVDRRTSIKKEKIKIENIFLIKSKFLVVSAIEYQLYLVPRGIELGHGADMKKLNDCKSIY